MQRSSAARAAAPAVALDRDDLAHRRPSRRSARSRPGRGASRSPRSRPRAAAPRPRPPAPPRPRAPDRTGAAAARATGRAVAMLEWRRGRRGRRAAPRAAPTRVTSGSQARPVALGDVGKVGDDQVEGRRLPPAAPPPLVGDRPLEEPTRSARPSRSALARATVERRGRGVGRRHLGIRAARRRPRARPRPTRCRRRAAARRLQLQRQLDQQLGLRPRDQHPAVDRQLDRAEAPCGRGCRRPARAAAAAGPSRRSAAPRRRGDLGRPDRRPGPPCPARSPRRAAVRRRGGARRPRPRAGHRRRRPGPRRRSPRRSRWADGGAHPTAAASSLRRFSSAASASVNSARSPPSTPSRLWEVSLIRWSVTRPWGKL